MNKGVILAIEDDKAIRNLLHLSMDIAGYDVAFAESGNAGILLAISKRPDIILLDLGLPDMSGVEVIQKIRSWSSVPIIVVSARSEDQDKIDALDAGADDYVTKPFSVDELLARMRVTLRHQQQLQGTSQQNQPIFQNGDLKIDFQAGCVYMKAEEIHVTPIEFRLLCLLARNTGKVLTHHYILQEVWVHATAEDTPSLRVFMATLRKKIEGKQYAGKYIQTHIGVGYRMLRVEETVNEHGE